MQCIVDGVVVTPEAASISIFDLGLLRGYGCFEAQRAYGGKVFRLERHLDRLERSAAALDIELPRRSEIAGWVREIAAANGDCIVRLFVTGGYPDEPVSPPRTFAFAESVPEVPAGLRFLPLAAPWHPGGVSSELTGAKTMSYAPNLRATREAQHAGFDDALLYSRDGDLLEGPTFCIGWFRRGVLETPSLDLGVLASITREAVLEAATGLHIPVAEGRYGRNVLAEADEVFAISTVKEVTSVVAVGEQSFRPGADTARVADAFREIVATETGT
jgi:branched-chain amino acid aminotransferase